MAFPRLIAKQDTIDTAIQSYHIKLCTQVFVQNECKHATCVKTPEAVVQDRQGIRGMGCGQLQAASEAICR